ncbi:hypothetical protein CC85DRAFT_160297 [Cutaneotrichosporon oleaginosum]|uniref:Uncharacterized protein n=1 Tax=Cutaneotrichosporon oleaginosum TaxID=879819 RepID=A0A0J0XGT3_9TREE|nr:uncharacterized protein CC85DRAFT_160297 [Cutaneotrichosporon oleaginosum]KLT40276.1 hypothetical protein CC85DRAFT_160297 [Cutaneotrichosporon oleaginosum]
MTTSQRYKLMLTASCQLPAASCQLPVASCQLPVARVRCNALPYLQGINRSPTGTWHRATSLTKGLRAPRLTASTRRCPLPVPDGHHKHAGNCLSLVSYMYSAVHMPCSPMTQLVWKSPSTCRRCRQHTLGFGTCEANTAEFPGCENASCRHVVPRSEVCGPSNVVEE